MATLSRFNSFLLATLVVMLLGWGSAGAESAQGRVAADAFEVASVKENTGLPGPPLLDARRFRSSGVVTVTNMALLDIIRIVYGENRVGLALEGGPDWIRRTRFDIIAKASPDPRESADAQARVSDAPVPAPKRMWTMMRRLLEERFNLQVRTESRNSAIYELRVVSGSAKPGLRSGSGNCEPPQQGPPPQGSSRPQCGVRWSSTGEITGDDVPLEALAASLSSFPGIGRRVDDKTGLSGAFDFRMTLPTEQGTRSASPPEIGATLITALKEQLGLVLVPAQGKVDVIVIEHVEPLIPN